MVTRTLLNDTLYAEYIVCLVKTVVLCLFHSLPQIDAICCVPTLAVFTAFKNLDLIQKFCAFGVSDGYVN
jgi:hypothetical protein